MFVVFTATATSSGMIASDEAMELPMTMQPGNLRLQSETVSGEATMNSK